jgi:hypothetical protein
MEPTREILDDEIEAIELGLNALAYGLRHTYMVALDMVAIKRATTPGSTGEAIVGHLPAQNLAVLQDARRKIGELMEVVGDYRNNTDCCTDREDAVTGAAFALMHDLAKQDAAPPQAESDGAA